MPSSWQLAFKFCTTWQDVVRIHARDVCGRRPFFRLPRYNYHENDTKGALNIIIKFDFLKFADIQKRKSKHILFN